MPQDETTTKPESEPTPPPKRRRRKWLWIVGGLFLALILLVVLGPTIASTSMARNIVLGKVNEQINGSVDIADWSVGWLSPTSVRGIKVYDEHKVIILEVQQIDLGISILDAVRSNFDFGENNVIDINNFNIKVDDAGESNLQKLPKSRRRERPEPPPKTETVSIPNVKGKFTVNFYGTVESPGNPAVHVRKSSAIVRITDINQPIENNVKLVYQVGDGDESTIETSGTADAIENNQPIPEKLVAAQKISLQNVNLAAAEPFLKKAGQEMKLAGIAKGDLDVHAEGLTGISAAGQIIVSKLLVAGGPLKGNDQFTTDTLTIPLNITRTTSGNDTVIKLEKVGVEMAQANVAVTGQVLEQALMNLAGGKAPGSEGTISIQARVTDLPRLTEQLRNTLNLDPSVKVNSGSIQNSVDLAIKRDTVAAAMKLDASARGTRGGNTPIELKPINVAASATARPTGAAVPDVRDLKLDVTGDFVKISGGGESLAKTNITGTLDLGKLRTELAQFTDLGQIQLQGNADFAVNTEGDVTNESAPIKGQFTANLRNVRVTGVVENQQINQDLLVLLASGTFDRKTSLLSDGLLTVKSGANQASPLLDVEAIANLNLSNPAQPKASMWELKKLDVTNLAILQQQYGGFVPALGEQKIEVKSGAIHATGGGDFDGTNLKISKPLMLSISSLSINKENRAVLANETIRANLAGSVSLGDRTSANLTELSVTSENKLFNLSKPGSAPLVVSIAKTGAIEGNGAVSLAADLKKLVDLAQAFKGQAILQPDQPQLQSGQMSGTITLTRAVQTSIDFNGQIASLTVQANRQNVLNNEQITIVLNAKAPSDLNSAEPITADGKIGSSFLNTTLSGAKVSMNGGPFEMVQSANVDVQIPSLPKLYALVQSMAPRAVQAAQQAQGRTAAPPRGDVGDAVAAPVMEVVNGSASVKLAIARDTKSKTTTLNVTDFQANQLALRRGRREYAFTGPVTMKFAASVTADKQIDSITVDQLNGDLRVATIEMPQKIVIANPMGAQPNLQGAIKVAGSIDNAKPLLAVLQDAEFPYAGQYVLNQNIKTQNALTTLDGSVDVTGFKVLGARPQEVAFSEDQVSIRNGVDLDLVKHNATVRTLTIDMPKSQALGVKFSGQINDWETARMVRGLGNSEKARLDLTYDTEKLWTIARPMLSPEMQETYKDLKIRGKSTRAFNVWGSLASKPGAQPLANMNGDGAVAVEFLDLPQGLTNRVLELPFTMTNGVVKTLPAPQSAERRIALAVSPEVPRAGRGNARSQPREIVAANGIVNDGALNIDQITIDLTAPQPLLSVPPQHVVVQMAKLNPVLADTLGKMGALIFKDAGKAEGKLTVTIIECDKVPVSELMTKGRVKMMIAVDDLSLDGPIPRILAQAADFGTEGIQGRVPPSTISLRDGLAETDLTVEIDRVVRDERTGENMFQPMPLKLAGGLGLANLDLRNFGITIPPGLLIRDLRKFAPNGAVIALKGTASKPQLDIEKFIKDNAVNGILGGIGGAAGAAGGGNNGQPADGGGGAGGLLNQILGGGNRDEPNNNNDNDRPRPQQERPQQQPRPAQERPAQERPAPRPTQERPAQQQQPSARNPAPAARQPQNQRQTQQPTTRGRQPATQRGR